LKKLSLEWKIIDGNKVALLFDKPTWALFQSVADSRNADTGQMITEAIAQLLGPIVARPSKD
jgi:hypothetical protein